MMWLAICDAGDLPALWAARGLRARGLTPLHVVSPAELVCAGTLELRLGSEGPARARAALASGLQLDSAHIVACLNRCAAPAYACLTHASPRDRAYFHAEWDAVLLAWLGALDAGGACVLNRAAPWALGGHMLPPLALALQAQRAGLETPPARCGLDGPEPLCPQAGAHLSHHLVMGEQVFPGVPDATAVGLVRVRRASGNALVGVVLEHRRGAPPRLCAAEPMPDLRIGGAAFLDALARAMSQTARTGTEVAA